MPRKIDHERVRFNAAFGISPDQLAKAITSLPLSRASSPSTQPYRATKPSRTSPTTPQPPKKDPPRMIDARRTELLTIRIEHGDRTVPSDLISALQTIPTGGSSATSAALT